MPVPLEGESFFQRSVSSSLAMLIITVIGSLTAWKLVNIADEVINGFSYASSIEDSQRVTRASLQAKKSLQQPPAPPTSTLP